MSDTDLSSLFVPPVSTNLARSFAAPVGGNPGHSSALAIAHIQTRGSGAEIVAGTKGSLALRTNKCRYLRMP